MFKIYQKYIIKKFLIRFFFTSLVFFILAIVLSVFEEISFFNNSNINFLLPYFLTFLNAPITLFEIFPFIFLISTQFFFYEIFKNDELIHLKNNGLSNLKIIKTLFLSSILLGLIMIFLYYNFAAKLKFLYTDIKNNYTNDNKYLAVVNDSGLWLKDETNEKTLIVKSKNIKNNYLIDVIINEFDSNFQLLQTIQANKVDIKNKKWIIYNPIITRDNISKNNISEMIYKTNFDDKKIRSLFSNFSTLNIYELFNLKKDYEELGYSSDEIKIHLLKLFSTPYFYALMTVLSSVIMINIRKNKSIIFNIILGIFVSVVIYYINYIFSSLGNTGKIPPNVAIFLPILFISIITLIGLVRINEK
jgi:lipopolysaccharide export system permease protein